ncbi:hypothetical protein C8A06_0845 [Microbacteriaceae bacterium MWH-Ta3]|nr:hypothetical protein C8A06_0845 [Microbacteriaceae bacterium MWH-Ta3]
MIEDFWANAIFSVTPTILIGLIFWFAMRAILRADRNERSSLARYEQEERERRNSTPHE